LSSENCPCLLMLHVSIYNLLSFIGLSIGLRIGL
jgi:hypothetical protein